MFPFGLASVAWRVENIFQAGMLDFTWNDLHWARLMISKNLLMLL
ncbi:hypothetical protein [Ktedonospora formicarum]|nr:hypothetical protein [Ktedonospora formicarum]